MQKVLVTGASGFIGRAICGYLVSQSYYVRGLVRHSCDALPGVEYVEADLDRAKSLVSICGGIDCIVHLAGRAHILSEKTSHPLEYFRKTNCEATLKLAKQAIDSGVRRFIFISSIGVNGSQTFIEPFKESSVPYPHADYAVSKFEAEQGLQVLLSGTETEFVVIRPPLVYSGNAPGNFRRLLALVATGVPMPFASLSNLRSMIALENLVDFITLCMKHLAAANQLFLISDGIDISTPQIIRYLAEGMGRQPRLFSMPSKWLQWASVLIGKQAVYTQLCGSLAIDSSKAKWLLGWQAPVSPQEALLQAGLRYREGRAWPW